MLTTEIEDVEANVNFMGLGKTTPCAGSKKLRTLCLSYNFKSQHLYLLCFCFLYLFAFIFLSEKKHLHVYIRNNKNSKKKIFFDRF